MQGSGTSKPSLDGKVDSPRYGGYTTHAVVNGSPQGPIIVVVVAVVLSVLVILAVVLVLVVLLLYNNGNNNNLREGLARSLQHA